MNCPLCTSNMSEGTTVVTITMESSRIIVVKNVPALLCEQCGEEYVNLSTSKNVEKQVKKAMDDGINMGFLSYTMAA